jgi:hypothetical protein
MADVYDNFNFYIKEGIVSEIERCKKLSNFIKKHKKDTYNNPIFLIANDILSY